MFDFFVSYNHDDAHWAQWLAWQIEEAGYSTVLQAWDFVEGQDFVRRMEWADKECERLLVVLSPSFLKSEYVTGEWASFYRKNPSTDKALILPVRVRPCKVGGRLGGLARIELLAASEEDAKRALLAAVQLRPPQLGATAPADEERAPRKKPASAPSFPGRAAPATVRPRVDYSQLTPKIPALKKADDELFSIAFSGDGRWIAAGSNKTALLWDLQQPEAVKSTGCHDDYVYSIAFSGDSQRFVTGGEDGYVRVWTVSPLKLEWQRRQHVQAVYSVAFSSNGLLVASGGFDRKVLLWDAKHGQPRSAGSDLDAVGRVTSVAFSHDDRQLVIGSLRDTVWLLDIRSGTARMVGKHDSSVEGVAFAPNGQLIASCGLDKAVCVWKVDDKVNPLKWRRREHDYLVRSVAFSPDGMTLASVGWDKRLILWDVDSAEVRADLPFDINDENWHSDWIWSVAFSTKGMLLASSSSDGRVIVWQVEGS